MGSVVERSGKWSLDFRYKGIRCREQTALENTKPNKKRVLAFLKRIEAEIRLDTFCYENHFPNSKKVEKFRAIEQMKNVLSDGTKLTFEDFSTVWQTEKRLTGANLIKTKLVPFLNFIYIQLLVND